MKEEKNYGLGFVPDGYLAPGESEYRIRDLQLKAVLGRESSSYRPLAPYELEALVKNGNACSDWSLVRVSDPFAPELVRSSEFAGLVRIGRLSRKVIEHHDLETPVGITDSRVIACDIGDDCAIHDCSYISHYIVGDSCLLLSNDEIHASNHAKFGNGIVMEGEGEDVRVALDLMNEAGGRSVLPFDGMTCADAYLWARRRDDGALMAAFKSMTDAMFDRRRGRYGTIGRGSVLKSNRIVKDVAIGESAYVKGANKLKNLTIRSSEEERTQIGEGCELVNGIVGPGCRVFYGCKAVRFVMGPNSALKYGARLIHSVLGDNSTVSCCEILNNLIFPAHEQHHNTSFLIAALVRGQSNMAAGATIGSNHNSRANDGEIEAGRGFWPGLSTSVKHSSRFASYCLLAKADYRYEIDLPLPFCLVDEDRARDRLVLVPAYWWTHNLYALMRNEGKFLARDRRIVKAQPIEFSPFAPDTAEETIEALELLEKWTGRALEREAGRQGPPAADDEGLRTRGAAYLELEGSGDDLAIEAIGVENSKRPVAIAKPRRAWRAYREILAWYAGNVLAQRLGDLEGEALREAVAELDAGPAERESSWENLGGLLAPASAVEALVSRIRSREIADWASVHEEYARLDRGYPAAKARHAWACLRYLEGSRDPATGAALLRSAMLRLDELAQLVARRVVESRAKDFANPFRKATYRRPEEMRAVVGSVDDNPFVAKCGAETAALRARARGLADRLA